jgi:putative ABC transport system permease protein
MWFLRQFPLAWRMLADRPARLALSFIGVSFAVVVMFTQLGFLNGITDSSANFATLLQSDLIVVHPRQEHLKSYVEFPLLHLFQVRDVPGVKSALPLYTGATNWSNPQTEGRNRVFIIGVDLNNPAALRVPELADKQLALHGANTFLFDRSVRPELGEVKEGTRSRVNGKPAHVVGVFSLGPNFAFEGNLITSSTNFLRLFPQSSRSVGLGMIWVNSGEQIETVRQRIRERFPNELEVLTPAEILTRELRYTTDHAPIGVVFGLGLIVGFAIGTVVCYQILFNEVSDHLPQFAMLKAVGHFPRSLTAIVLHEALVLSVGGDLAGVSAAAVLYHFLQWQTALVMALTPGRAALVLLLTSGMCLLAGRLALKKVQNTDPADLF